MYYAIHCIKNSISSRYTNILHHVVIHNSEQRVVDQVQILT